MMASPEVSVQVLATAGGIQGVGGEGLMNCGHDVDAVFGGGADVARSI
jgi:hypothetical protein